MPDDKLTAYIAAIVPLMGEARVEVDHALSLIAKRLAGRPNVGHYQLLALRRYLRIGAKRVRAQWAWTPEEAARFSQTPAGQLLDQEAQRVQKAFATSNPGYTLAVSPLRSLERQVVLWTSNATVKRAAQRFTRTYCRS